MLPNSNSRGRTRNGLRGRSQAQNNALTHGNALSTSSSLPIHPISQGSSTSSQASTTSQHISTTIPTSNSPQSSHPSPPASLSEQLFPTTLDHVKRFQRFARLATYMKYRIIHDWVPHRVSPEERHTIRRETAQRIGKIRALEAAQSRIAPVINDRLQDNLFIARIEYQINFPRTFRINDLPTEIVTNIFRYVAWSAPDTNSGVRWRLWLTWSCKHWRTIALEDHTLWSAIWFRDAPPFDRSLAWFERAGSAPLDLRMSDRKDFKFTDKIMATLLDKLFTKISTIRMLIVIIEDWEPVLTVLDKLRSAGRTGARIAMERLEVHRVGSPYVQIGAGYQPSSFREPMALFGGAPAPCLKYISFNGVHINWQQSSLINLTTIDIRRIPLELSPGILHFRHMLACSPNLRKLCLDGAGPQLQLDEARGLPPVLLNSLKILVVADFSVHYAHYILSHINAPHVRDLTLMNFGGEDYSPLFLMMTGRFAEVRLLTIYSIGVIVSSETGRTMVKWLETMPVLGYLRIANIKKLFLDLFLYDPNTFKHLHQEQLLPRKILCPKLSVLECQGVEPDMIAGFGRARQELGVPIQKVYLSQDLSKRITRRQHEELSKISGIFILEHGVKTKEEETLMIQ